MHTRCSGLGLVLTLLLSMPAQAQFSLPARVHVEPSVSYMQIRGTVGGFSGWETLYGGRIAVSMAPKAMIYAGYWPTQTLSSFRRQSITLRQWEVGLRVAVPLAPANNLFGSLDLGMQRSTESVDFQSDQGYRGYRSDQHIEWGRLATYLEYWLAPYVALRGGVGASIGDGIQVSFEVGLMAVPLRW